MYSCFYLTIHRRRASKSGETSSKPLLFWRFFSKFSKNLRQNTPLKKLFFPFWRNFASKKKKKLCCGRRSGKRQDRMKLSLPPKLVEKLVWVPVILLCKIFIPSYTFDALLCRNWPFSPPQSQDCLDDNSNGSNIISLGKSQGIRQVLLQVLD